MLEAVHSLRAAMPNPRANQKPARPLI